MPAQGLGLGLGLRPALLLGQLVALSVQRPEGLGDPRVVGVRRGKDRREGAVCQPVCIRHGNERRAHDLDHGLQGAARGQRRRQLDGHPGRQRPQLEQILVLLAPRRRHQRPCDGALGADAGLRERDRVRSPGGVVVVVQIRLDLRPPRDLHVQPVRSRRPAFGEYVHLELPADRQLVAAEEGVRARAAARVAGQESPSRVAQLDPGIEGAARRVDRDRQHVPGESKQRPDVRASARGQLAVDGVEQVSAPGRILDGRERSRGVGAGGRGREGPRRERTENRGYDARTNEHAEPTFTRTSPRVGARPNRNASRPLSNGKVALCLPCAAPYGRS